MGQSINRSARRERRRKKAARTACFEAGKRFCGTQRCPYSNLVIGVPFWKARAEKDILMPAVLVEKTDPTNGA